MNGDGFATRYSSAPERQTRPCSRWAHNGFHFDEAISSPIARQNAVRRWRISCRRYGAVAKSRLLFFLLRGLLQRHQDEKRDDAQERSHSDVAQEVRAQDHAAGHDDQGENDGDREDESQPLPQAGVDEAQAVVRGEEGGCLQRVAAGNDLKASFSIP